MFVYIYVTAGTGRQPYCSKQINNNNNKLGFTVYQGLSIVCVCVFYPRTKTQHFSEICCFLECCILRHTAALHQVRCNNKCSLGFKSSGMWQIADLSVDRKSPPNPPTSKGPESFETSITTQPMTRCNIPQDVNRQPHRCENHGFRKRSPFFNKHSSQRTDSTYIHTHTYIHTYIHTRGI